MRITLHLGDRSYEFDPSDSPVLIGRSVTDGVCVESTLVSRRHAELVYRDGWTVADLGSTNGTWRDGDRITSAVPIAGDLVIRLGDHASGPELEIRRPVSVDPQDEAVGSEGKTAHHQARIVGRDPAGWLTVADPMASWHHAKLVHQGGRWWLEDLGSTNQTIVNGKAVSRHPLAADDRVLIGNTHFAWRDHDLHPLEDAEFVVDKASWAIRDGRRIVNDVSFSMSRPSLVAVIGPSGAGKSSLLRLVTGQVEPTSGSVSLFGATMTSQRRAHRGQIGVVPQHTVAHTALTARQVMDHTARLRLADDVGKQERDRLIERVLTRLGLQQHGDTKMSRLSGGQQRRVGIAMEMITDPSMLILDEPTAGLDPSLVLQIMRVLRDLADAGTRVLVVTHDLEHLELVDNVLVLRAGGTVAYHGPPAGVFQHFGTTSWAETFALLSEPAESSSSGPPAVVRPTSVESFDIPALPPRMTTVVKQAWVVARRQVRLIATDPLYLALLAGMPIALAGLALTVPGHDGLGATQDPTSTEAARLLVLLTVGAAFLGLSSSIRDLVAERPIYSHEREAGLAPLGYLAAKLAVFTTVAVAQTALLVGLVIALRPGPEHSLLLPSPGLELGASIGLTAMAGVSLGLAVSARVRTSEQAMPPLVLLVMAQLVLCGGLFPVDGRGVLPTLSMVFPTRWGYAAAAATVDLNHTSSAVDTDGLWVHTASNWIGCVMVLTALWCVFAGVAAVGVSRRRLD